MNKVKIEDTEVFKEVANVIGEKQAKIELFRASKNWDEGDIKDILSGEDLSGCFSWEDTPQGYQFWLDIA